MQHHNQRDHLESRDHVSVEIVMSNASLASSIREKMETISPSLCIYRVPENIREVNPNAYVPDKVSIGPFHRGDRRVETMEGQKWHYLNALLSRKPNLEASLDECVKFVRELEHRARKCYQGSIALTSDEFVEMMIVDGCFIIELFLRYAIKGLRRREDPVFNQQGMLFDLRCDMLLLENQIPFFMIECLFGFVPIPKQCEEPLTKLAFRFFKIMIPGDPEVLQGRFCRRGNHLLDFIRNCFFPYTHKAPLKQNATDRTIHNVEQLQESGVKFKKAVANSLLEVKFVNGVLKIPPILIHSYTDSLLRNLIAFEQCSMDYVKYVTSYGFLMSSLVSSSKDVQLLHQKRIISNRFGNDVETCLMFTKLCKEVEVKEFYYAELVDQVNAYSGWWVTMKRNYWKSPRNKCMFIFVFVLVVLTIIGTLFSVLSFYLHRR